ncbi:RNA polymerase sigma factor [Marinactinospora thermotolerans]|uniref:RNA polymerase, sigma subunit, ECF family n=1 Tax=Marinactinospora thermotolerans DSM 45154 TaxID=1122192 RepID=A0A1T4R9P3_9ACTN|nr:sigma-70 family RNA polymerase sigma factor [Marinactinospora thermotolerans]SKA12742.1 RNA polymerase, sigma subunit, ECF family [Marinactinospora thermotolerans DSM 45154]
MTRSEEDPDASTSDGFARLFERHYPDVYRYALRRLGPDQADDVAAETFAVAWRRRDRIPGHAPLPWLYATARNIVLARSRGARRRGELFGLFDGEPPGLPASSDAAGQVLDRQTALSALKALRPRERELVMLLAWEGLDMPAAAQVLGCTVATARVRLHRARKRIQRLLADSAAQPDGDGPGPLPLTRPTLVEENR